MTIKSDFKLIDCCISVCQLKGNYEKTCNCINLSSFTGSAYAGSCPMMAKNLDTKIEEAQKMRDAGMKAHDAGEHAKSEELLNKALEMFKS